MVNYLEAPNDIRSWLFSVDHKRIGLLHLYSLITFFLVEVSHGLLMQFLLLKPGKDLMEAKTFNLIFTLNGVIVILFFIIPSISAVFGDIFCPFCQSALRLLMDSVAGNPNNRD